MKKILFVIAIIFSIMACNNDDDINNPIIVDTGNTIKYTETIINGGQGGKTVGLNSNKSLRSKNNSFYLSSYPLLEQRYIIEKSYDSVPTHVIDTITNDTISTSYEVFISNIDTVDHKTGKLWLPYDDFNVFNLYLGIDTTTLKDRTLMMTLNILDSLKIPEHGLLFSAINLYSPSEWGDLIDKHPIILDSTKYDIVDYIPIYNEFGNIESYGSGIRLNDVLLRQYDIVLESNSSSLRHIELVIEDSTYSISSEFKLQYVEEDEYLRRLCWLSGSDDCKDYYDE